MTQIKPLRVLRLDQLELPRPPPPLKLFFPSNRVIHAGEVLHEDKAVNPVFRRESLEQLVLVPSSLKIVGHADVDGSGRARHNIDEVLAPRYLVQAKTGPALRAGRFFDTSRRHSASPAQNDIVRNAPSTTSLSYISPGPTQGRHYAMITTAHSLAHSTGSGAARGSRSWCFPRIPRVAERMTIGRCRGRRPRPLSDRGYRLACRTKASGHFGDVPANRSVISSRIPALPGPCREISRAMAFGTRGRVLGQHEFSTSRLGRLAQAFRSK